MGGKFSTESPNYFGGNVTKFDYVDLNDIGVDYLDKLCEKLGYMGIKRYYKLEANGFVLFNESHHILQYCLLHEKDIEVTIYLDATLIELNSEVGASNARVNEPIEEDSDDSVDCEDFSDSEYDLNSVDKEDVAGDDTLFENHVDAGEEWAGNIPNDNVAEHATDDESEGVVVSDSEDFDSEMGSEEDEPRFPVCSTQDTYDPRFQLRMYFTTKTEFRIAIHSHAIQTKRNLKITKNDLRRIYAKCGEEGCEWRCHALALGEQSCFQVREYHSVHRCGTSYHVKNCSSSWLGEKYEWAFRSDPKRNVKGFRLDIVREMNVHVSRNQAYRAKWSALKKIEGNAEDQYKSLCDYVEELRTSNPNSTIILSVKTDGRFGKLYTCFKGLKDGFLAGCRPIIGVDGCHLKGPHGGVVLCAVGLDPNNCIFPFAWAVVEKETKDSWEWFLTVVKHDLKIESDYEWTFMSDKQKGLIPAFDTVFPCCENRFCVKHLHGNMKRHGFRGLQLKKALWKAGRASTVAEFNTKMQDLTKLDPKAVEWLNDKPPKHWSMSHFTCTPKCDILLNNMCELFNSKILEAREKNIVTMLEMIRETMLTRMQTNRDKSARWRGKICPKIRKLLEINHERASDCIPTKSTNVLYEIDCCDRSKCKVDLANRTCSCIKWELSGIPCKRAMSAINSKKLKGEDFVHQCYFIETYRKVYEHCILPINGSEKWKKTGLVPPLPPNIGRKVGRPSTARRLEPEEPPLKQKKRSRWRKQMQQGHRLRRQHATIHCKYCGGEGHNIKGCLKKKDAEAHIEEGNQDQQENTVHLDSQGMENDGYVNIDDHFGGVDWEEGINWEQVSMEVNNLETMGCFVSQPSVQQSLDSQKSVQINSNTSMSSQAVPEKGLKFTARKRTYSKKQKQNSTSSCGSGLKSKGKGPAQSLTKGSYDIGGVRINDKGPIKKSNCVGGMTKKEKGKGPASINSSKPAFKPPSQSPRVHCPIPALSRLPKPTPTPSRLPMPSSFVFGQVPTPYFGPSPIPTTSRASSSAMRPQTTPYKVIEKDGRKFVTMKSLTTALDIKKAENSEKLKNQNAKF